jgi:release factor H-coupled RctB family protein
MTVHRKLNMNIRAIVYLYNHFNNKNLIIFKTNSTLNDILKKCTHKLGKKIKFVYLDSGHEVTNIMIKDLSNDCVFYCSETNIKDEIEIKDKATNIAPLTILATNSFICDDSLKQCQHVCKLPYITSVIAMPDLHPGKEYPIGIAVISRDKIYHHLVGDDIGCGMSFIKCNELNKVNINKLSQILVLENELQDDEIKYILENEIKWCESLPKIDTSKYGDMNKKLGTIGGGNHFLELQTIEEILDQEIAAQFDLDMKSKYVLVHSGSREIGSQILKDYHDHNGMMVNSDKFKDYMHSHDTAVIWARKNRYAITKKLLSECNIDISSALCLIDISHNSISTSVDKDNTNYYIHRKGAAPAMENKLVIIPGSRGAFSYVVMPINPNLESGFSLAHGAGRKLGRNKALQSMKNKYHNISDLTTTKMDNFVICTDKNLLYEEAPEAYKDISAVIDDLVKEKLIKVVAIMKPILTYKTR